MEEFKELYNQLDNTGNKGQFIEDLARLLGKSERTVKVHWIPGNVPERYLPVALDLLRKTVALQEKHKAEKAKILGIKH